MRIALLAFFTALSSAPVAAQQTSPTRSLPITVPKDDGRPVIVRLPNDVAEDTCLVDRFQTGSFGGFSGGASAIRVERHTVAIPTSQDARTLKAIVWCRGFGVGLVDIPSLETSQREVTISPPRVKALRLSGRVIPAGTLTLAGLDLRIRFEAWWVCGYFKLADCMIPMFPIGATKIGKDGMFSVDLPDVLSDPALKPYGALGAFALDVEEPAPSFRRYRLEPPGGRTLAPAASYTQFVELTIKQ